MQAANVASAVENQRCQWCGGPIPDAATHCPACGAAVVNPALSVEPVISSDVSDGQSEDPTQAFLKSLEQPVLEERPRQPIPGADTSIHPLFIFVVAVIVGGAAGMILGPPLLSHLYASAFDITANGHNPFRQIGAFFGVLAGLMVASTIGIFRRH